MGSFVTRAVSRIVGVGVFAGAVYLIARAYQAFPEVFSWVNTVVSDNPTVSLQHGIYLTVLISGMIITFISLLTGAGLFRYKDWARVLYNSTWPSAVIITFYLYGFYVNATPDETRTFVLRIAAAVVIGLLLNTFRFRNFFNKHTERTPLPVQIVQQLSYFTLLAAVVSVAVAFIGMRSFNRTMPALGRATYPTDAGIPWGREYASHEVFDYHIFLPRDMAVKSVNIVPTGRAERDFTLVMAQPGERFSIELSGDMHDRYRYAPVMNIVNERSLYRFERNVITEEYNPLFYFVKTMTLPRSPVGVEEIVAENFKGFCVILYDDDSRTWRYQYALYPRDESHPVSLAARADQTWRGQVPKLMSTLAFRPRYPGEAVQLFKGGREALDRKEYAEATEKFLTALELDKSSYIYSYEVALALYENPDPGFRRERLAAAQKMLEYSRDMKPGYMPVNDLYEEVSRALEALPAPQ